MLALTLACGLAPMLSGFSGSVAAYGAAALAAALVARLAFDILAQARGDRLDLVTLWAAARASALALPVALVSPLIAGTRVDLFALLVAFVGSNTVLTFAATCRGAEMRYRARNRRVFYIGADRASLALVRDIGRGDMGLVGRCLLSDGSSEADLAELRDVLQTTRPTTVVLSQQALADPRIVLLVGELHRRGIRIREFTAFYEQEFGKVAVSELLPSWFLFDIPEIHAARVYGTLKRAGETLLAVLAAVVTAPLIPLIALGIKRSSPGPVFFAQPRGGKDGVPFTLLKFRTMHTAAGREHGFWATSGDARIFPLGRLLRKVRLDELPQLWNIIRGELSLVGPRPEQPSIVTMLESSIPYYGARHAVRPGLTGWAQINYGYGGTHESVVTKLQYDLYYVKNQSLRLDLWIAAQTIKTLVAGAGR